MLATVEMAAATAMGDSVLQGCVPTVKSLQCHGCRDCNHAQTALYPVSFPLIFKLQLVRYVVRSEISYQFEALSMGGRGGGTRNEWRYDPRCLLRFLQLFG